MWMGLFFDGGEAWQVGAPASDCHHSPVAHSPPVCLSWTTTQERSRCAQVGTPLTAQLPGEGRLARQLEEEAKGLCAPCWGVDLGRCLSAPNSGAS